MKTYPLLELTFSSLRLLEKFESAISGLNITCRTSKFQSRFGRFNFVKTSQKKSIHFPWSSELSFGYIVCLSLESFEVFSLNFGNSL